jgi:hypothetical protein
LKKNKVKESTSRKINLKFKKITEITSKKFRNKMIVESDNKIDSLENTRIRSGYLIDSEDSLVNIDENEGLKNALSYLITSARPGSKTIDHRNYNCTVKASNPQIKKQWKPAVKKVNKQINHIRNFTNRHRNFDEISYDRILVKKVERKELLLLLYRSYKFKQNWIHIKIPERKEILLLVLNDSGGEAAEISKVIGLKNPSSTVVMLDVSPPFHTSQMDGAALTGIVRMLLSHNPEGPYRLPKPEDSQIQALIKLSGSQCTVEHCSLTSS